MAPVLLLSIGVVGLVACGDDPPGGSGGSDTSGGGGDGGGNGGSGGAGGTQDPFSVVDPSDVISLEVEQELQQEFESLLGQQGAMGGQLAVWWKGELVLLLVAGQRSAEDPTPVDRDTLFMLGSTAKMLAATTLLQQVEAGSLATTDTVDTAIGGFSLARSPEWSATLHEILTHQSGLYDLFDSRPAADDAALASGVEAFAENGWAHVPAGEVFDYSNANYSLVARAVEIATGRPWADVLEQDLAARLGMSRTVARTTDALADTNHCFGVVWKNGADPDPWNPLETWDYAFMPTSDPPIDNAFTRPAGLVWSTAVDELRFARFLLEGDPGVLSDELRDQMTTSHVDTLAANPGFGYGYGLFVSKWWWDKYGFVQMPVWEHAGGSGSHTSNLLIFPEQELAISVLGAGGDALYLDLGLAYEVADMLLPGLPPGSPPTDQTEADPLDLVGTYEDPALGPMIVAFDGSALTLEIQAMAELGLEPVQPLWFAGATDYYFADGFGLDFKMVKDDQGVYRWMVNRWVGGERID